MLTVTINNTDYRTPSSWQDITLATYIAFLQVPIPSEYKAIQQASGEAKKQLIQAVTDQMYFGDFMPYFCKAIETLAGIPMDVLMQCQPEQVESLYNSFISRLNPPKENTAKKVANIGGEEWYYPQRLMIKSCVAEYVEAAQFEKMILDEKRHTIEALPRVMACLLKKENEYGKPISDELLEQRAAFFLNAPMSEAWQLYFFLLKRNNIYQLGLQIVSGVQKALR